MPWRSPDPGQVELFLPDFYVRSYGSVLEAFFLVVQFCRKIVKGLTGRMC
jgi:hypothetical protein